MIVTTRFHRISTHSPRTSPQPPNGLLRTELLCRTDADSQTLKNLRSREETPFLDSQSSTVLVTSCPEKGSHKRARPPWGLPAPPPPHPPQLWFRSSADVSCLYLSARDQTPGSSAARALVSSAATEMDRGRPGIPPSRGGQGSADQPSGDLEMEAVPPRVWGPTSPSPDVRDARRGRRVGRRTPPAWLALRRQQGGRARDAETSRS